MKSDRLKKKLLNCVVLVTMILLTSCSSVKPVERVSASGWITLQKGETFKAPKDMLLAEEFVVQEIQQELIDTLEAVNKYILRKDLGE